MCSKGGGSPPVPSAASTTFNSTVQPSAFATPLYQDFLNRANTLSNTPFNPEQLGKAAPLNADQTAAGQQLMDLGMHMGDFDPARVTSIMSPFTEQVVGATQNWFNNQNAIQGNDLLSQAIRSGNAFGGDRAGVAESVLAGQQQLAQAPVIAGLRQAGYTQALDEYNKLKQFGLQGAGAALGWGSMEQAQTQKEFDVAQQNAMMQSAYPFQTLNWYGSLLGGMGPLLGQTAFGSNNPPEQSGLAAGLGAATAGVGLASSLIGSGGGASPTGAGGKRGGVVEHFLPIRRARGGLVPVFIRHNGGIIQGLAYGGSTDNDGDDQDRQPPSRYSSPDVYRSGEDSGGETSREDSSSRGYGSTTLPPPPRRATRSDLGLDPANIRSTGPTFPVQAGTSGAAAQPQKSGLQTGLEFATKALPLATSLFALSDPKTKTDVQRVGKTDDGKPLYGFRYRGDPKSYPKVVGPMATPGRYQSGGDIDTVASDADPDPIVGGQQFARDYAGRTTWFNPRNERGGYTYTDDSGQNWTDYGAQRLREGKHASGLPSTTPGFATPGSADLGNWFEVSGPGGARSYAQKTDIGPPGVVDLNAPLAARMYGRPNAIPGGTTQVRDLGRDQPPEAGGTRWPDPSKGNTDLAELPSGQQPSVPQPVPGARLGRAASSGVGGPDDSVPRSGYGAGPGTGAVGSRIPGAPPKTWAQNLAGNPFWQLGTALMAKPGIKGRELSALGGAAQSMSGQQIEQRKQDLLENKPELMHTDQGIMFRYPNGQIVPTGLKAQGETRAAGQEARAEAESKRKGEKHEREMEGDSITVKGLWGDQRYGWNNDTKKYDIPLDVAQTPQPATPQIAPKPAAPATPPPAAPSAQPQPQLRQTEAAPAWQPGATTDPRITGQPFHTAADLSSFPPQSRPAEAAPAGAAPAAAPTQTAQTAQAPQAGQAGPVGAQSAEAVPDEEKDTVAQLRRSGGFKTPLDPKRYDPRMLQYFNKTPEDFDFLAGRLALGDTSVLQGYGNSKQAAVFKSGLRSRADQYYIDRGLGPEKANAAVAFNMAQKAGARSLATQEARISGALGTAMQTAPRVIETSEKVDRTRFPDLNKLILFAKQRSGDQNAQGEVGNVVRFGLAIETFVNNYARAMGGGNNVMTDAAREQAHLFMQNNYSKGQINAAIDQAMIEMDSELTGVRGAMSGYLGTAPEVAYKPGDVFKGRTGQQPAQQAPQQQKQLSPEDRGAIDWARRNPNNPNSKKILDLHGVQ